MIASRLRLPEDPARAGGFGPARPVETYADRQIAGESQAAVFRKINLLLLFGIAATLPLEAVTVGDTGVEAFSLTRVIAIIALGFAVLDIVFSGPRIPRTPLNFWVAAFLFAFVLACVYGSIFGWIPATVYVLIAIRFLSVILLYFILCQLIKTRQDLDVFLWGLVIGGAIGGVFSFFDTSTAGQLVERKKGIGAGANQHAGNLLMVLPLAYALFFTARRRILKLVLLGAAGATLLGVVLATSRSAFLAALGMGGVWMLRFRRPSDLKYVAAMAFAFVMAAMFSPRGYVERLMTITDAAKVAAGDELATAQADQSSTQRWESWKAGAHAFATSPLGVGIGNFGTWAIREGYRLEINEGSSVHNSTLMCASTMGIVGLVPYLAIVLLTWTELSRAQRIARRHRMRGDPELGSLYLRAIMVQIGFIGIAVVAQFQPGLIWKGMWAMFGLSAVIVGLTERRVRALVGAGAQAAPALLGSPGTGFGPAPARG